MIKLDLTNAPRMVDLGYGVTVEIRPGNTAIIAKAQADMVGAYDRVAFGKAFARNAILSWEGVDGDVSPDAIDALMDLWPIFVEFEKKVIGPALLVVTEGNA